MIPIELVPALIVGMLLAAVGLSSLWYERREERRKRHE